MPEKYQIEIDALAQADLDSIYQYICWASADKDLAGVFTARIKNALKSIAFMPKAFPRILDDALYAVGYRKLVFGDYIVPFIINDDTKTVNVMRVLHGKMDYQRFL